MSNIAKKRIRRTKEPKQNAQQFDNEELSEFINEDLLAIHTLHLLDDLKPYETMGLLPSPSIN